MVWDGAWLPLTVLEELLRFVSFYIGSAEYLSELAVSWCIAGIWSVLLAGVAGLSRSAERWVEIGHEDLPLINRSV